MLKAQPEAVEVGKIIVKEMASSEAVLCKQQHVGGPVPSVWRHSTESSSPEHQREAWGQLGAGQSFDIPRSAVFSLHTCLTEVQVQHQRVPGLKCCQRVLIVILRLDLPVTCLSWGWGEGVPER